MDYVLDYFGNETLFRTISSILDHFSYRVDRNGAWGCLKFNLKLVECQLNPRGRTGEGGEIPG